MKAEREEYRACKISPTKTHRRVEDDVWIRAIMEETLDDVEGHKEIFLRSLLPIFRKMDREIGEIAGEQAWSEVYFER